MIFLPTPIEGCFEIEYKLNTDERGHFSRLFCRDLFKQALGVALDFVQINLSSSIKKGQIRGLHYYSSENPEYKMIYCIKGKIYDICVDLRKDSPTYLKYHTVILSPDVPKLFLIPPMCAHGFQTLTPGVEMIYFHTMYYDPQYDRGIYYQSPSLNIEWPIEDHSISEKDANLPKL